MVCRPKFTVIREPYSTDFAAEILEEQLEVALESNVQYIVIEPIQVGNEISSWIRVGNFLHKSSVFSGLLCLSAPLALPTRFKLYTVIPLTSINLLCTGLYDLSWQYDPCCKYQVETRSRQLERLQLQALSMSNPVVLVRRDDKYRKRLHNFLTVCVLSYWSWKVIKWYLD